MDKLDLEFTPDGTCKIPPGDPATWNSAMVFHFPDGDVRLEGCHDMDEIVRRWNAFPALVDALTEIARDGNPVACEALKSMGNQ